MSYPTIFLVDDDASVRDSLGLLLSLKGMRTQLFANAEGKVAAPEAAHGIRAAIDEALAAKETGEEKVILFNYCGHGFLDLQAYDDFNHGRLVDA